MKISGQMYASAGFTQCSNCPTEIDSSVIPHQKLKTNKNKFANYIGTLNKAERFEGHHSP